MEFIEPTERNENNCIDEKHFEGRDVGFHGTSERFLSSILTSGLKSAAQLGSEDGLSSVSFSRHSNTAYAHATDKYSGEVIVVLVVDLGSIQQNTVCPEGDVFYVYDPNPKPCVIAYCTDS